MRAGATALNVASSFALAAGSASAMNIDRSSAVSCVVEGGEKLPSETGGTAAICAAIGGAIKAESVNSDVRVRVQVKSNTWLVAEIERDGKVLPTQNMAVSDGKLRKSSIEHFAHAIAGAVAAAGRGTN
jgi:hypothetical protein